MALVLWSWAPDQLQHSQVKSNLSPAQEVMVISRIDEKCVAKGLKSCLGPCMSGEKRELVNVCNKRRVSISTATDALFEM